MSDPDQVRAARNDSGFVLVAVLVDLTITALLFATVIGFLFFAVRLVQSASPDTNPLVWSTLTSSVARLEGSLAPPLDCKNPEITPPLNSRKDCLTVKAEPIRPIVRPGVEDTAVCWTVTNDEALKPDGTPLPDQRRLECWELLDSDYLRIWVHDHNEVDENEIPLTDTTDLLAITNWQPSPDPALSRTATHGLAAIEWQCLTSAELTARPNAPVSDSCSRSRADMPQVAAVELVACAAVRPDDRNVMKPGLVPFCDGTTGVVLSDGSYRGRDNPNHPDSNDWGTIEGYLLPALSLDIGSS